MSKELICPTTLAGIKRLAKSLKVERGIPHTKALDAAAQAAHFQNFQHARNVLQHPTEARRPQHRLYLTSYWKDRASGASGRETLTLDLSDPWGDLIAPLQLLNHRATDEFRSAGPDHLQSTYRHDTQSKARHAVCAAARAFQFMDATKLRPSKGYSRALPNGDSSKAIPGRDHYSVWFDPLTKRYLFVDEPYGPAVKNRQDERQAWATKYGYGIAMPEWAGMHAPDVGSRLFLISEISKGVPLEPLVSALNRLPEPVVESPWTGQSAPSTPIFVSPGSLAAGENKHKLARQKSKPDNSVPYSFFLSRGRRPKVRMPITGHAEVGGLLKSVLIATYHRKGVYNRVNSIRSKLDDWAQCEYTSEELPGEQFFDLYYHESGATFSKSISDAERRQHINSLEVVKTLLTEHYPDSVPLRELLKKTDMAISSLETWR
ncbi:DUF5623 domain-containing protein [Alcaligenes phenolicus]|uniref:DUF5623 domain-containing protein n=1 Tax=Alcaligenes phenolicus TaxID=232846 RepID=A0AAW5VSA9_9BURK|nr:DUF5623 domain-containing protein [Alcaligenes phenolicus]MCX5563773.1 DUF5623 domain-containing protein [Alcaligenes phenolicus]